MRIQIQADVVTIQTTPQEVFRLGLALREGCEALSRAEFFIRSGLSQPEVFAVADALIAWEAGSGPSSVDLGVGEEEVENPRRGR